MIKLIVATSKNRVIGNNNTLPWHLSEDLKRFKKMTIGKNILMGRKTFETFPRPLPNRTHLIITNQENYQVPENCLTFKTIQEPRELIEPPVITAFFLAILIPTNTLSITLPVNT